MFECITRWYSLADEGERKSEGERESERTREWASENERERGYDIHIVSFLCPPTALYDVKRCRNWTAVWFDSPIINLWTSASIQGLIYKPLTPPIHTHAFTFSFLQCSLTYLPSGLSGSQSSWLCQKYFVFRVSLINRGGRGPSTASIIAKCSRLSWVCRDRRDNQFTVKHSNTLISSRSLCHPPSPSTPTFTVLMPYLVMTLYQPPWNMAECKNFNGKYKSLTW